MYVKLQEYLLFIFWQVKLIEDEWFSSLKLIKSILPDQLLKSVPSWPQHPPKV